MQSRNPFIFRIIYLEVEFNSTINVQLSSSVSLTSSYSDIFLWFFHFYRNMVEKSSLKEKKQKTAQIIKASLLPRLRVQADQAILKDFVFDIMRMLKENNGKSENVLFGMKSAQRAIRRRQAQLVLVDSLLPKCISGEFY